MTVSLVNPFLAIAGGGGGGGSDVTPTAVNWAAITITDTSSGIEQNADQTIAAIDTTIQLKAAWTSTSGSPAKGAWVKNGAVVGGYAVTPVYVNAVVGDALHFTMKALNSFTQGNYDSGTVTVTNESDGAATLDTFTFEVQYIYSLL